MSDATNLRRVGKFFLPRLNSHHRKEHINEDTSQLSTINKTMTKKTKTIEFQKEKDTKNTVKFAEVQTQGEAPVVGTLYVQKC